MKSCFYVAIAVTVEMLLGLSLAVGVEPYFVYRDLDLFGNVIDSPHCVEDVGRPPCRVEVGPNTGLPGYLDHGSVKSSLRIPQFWDGTPFEVGFFADFLLTGCPENLTATFEASILDPDSGNVVASTSIEFPAENNAGHVTGTFSDVQFLTAGKLYVVVTTIDIAECLGAADQIAGVSLKFPVILPFIFENGFEEGQAAFWSELYGY